MRYLDTILALAHARGHTLLSTTDHTNVATYLNQALLTTSIVTHAGYINSSPYITDQLNNQWGSWHQNTYGKNIILYFKSRNNSADTNCMHIWIWPTLYGGDHTETLQVSQMNTGGGEIGTLMAMIPSGWYYWIDVDDHNASCYSFEQVF